MTDTLTSRVESTVSESLASVAELASSASDEAASAPTPPAAVTARGVTRAFRDRQVLDGMDLTVGPGEVVALIGRRGTGKSTLLRILGGLDPGYGGDVVVPERRAIVLQESRLNPWQRVLSNVVVGLEPGLGGRAELKRRGLAALDEVAMRDHAGAWPIALSAGEAQRVALARALVREPELVLLDEPFGALDEPTRTRMYVLIQDLWARRRPAVLLATLDVDEALLLADRAVVLVDGRVTFDQPIELDRPRWRGDPGFVALRDRLLAELGVNERGLTAL